MEVTSSALGVYTIVFEDKAVDHAFGEHFCSLLQSDPRVERASHYSDYDSQKLEVVIQESVASTVQVKDVMRDVVSTMRTQVADLLACVY